MVLGSIRGFAAVLTVGIVASSALRSTVAQSPQVESRALDSQRRAVERVFELGGAVRTRADGVESPRITRTSELPEGDWDAFEVRLGPARITDDHLAILADFPAIERLLLNRCQIGDGALSHLRKLDSLITLDLSETLVTDAGIGQLAELPNLRILSLACTAVTDAGMAELAKMSDLERLYLDRMTITDIGVRHLSALSKLELLNLAYDDITDSGAMSISQLKALKTLILTQAFISDVGLSQLAKLNAPAAIDVMGGPASRWGVARLQAAFPDCVIKFSPRDSLPKQLTTQALAAAQFLPPDDPRAAQLVAGLTMLNFPALPAQSAGYPRPAPWALGEPVDQPQTIESLSMLRADRRINAVGLGYLKIDQAGEYSFRRGSPDGDAAIWIGTARLEEQPAAARLTLPAGYVPLLCAVYGTTAKGPLIEWLPPGAAAFTDVPHQDLRHAAGHEALSTPEQYALESPALESPPRIQPPPRVRVTSPRGLTPVASAALCRNPLPAYLEQSTAMTFTPSRGGGHATQGRVDVEVLEDTALYLAARWFEIANDDGAWKQNRVSMAGLASRGWVLIGDATFLDRMLGRHALYWRLCKQGEKFSIQTLKVVPPIVIVPADPASNPIPHIPDPAQIDYVAGSVMKSKISYLLQQRQFGELEALATDYRRRRPIFHDGREFLYWFYEAFRPEGETEADWESAETSYNAWRDAHPDSLAAHLALTHYWEAFAWRGSRPEFAGDVRDARQEKFRNRAAIARGWLDLAESLDEDDVGLAHLQILLGVDQAAQPEQIEEFIARALELDPTFMEAILAGARFYLQRWYGKEGDVERFAARWADATRAEWGDAMYARVAYLVYGGYRDPSASTFDWDRLKRGFVDWQARSPHSTLPTEYLARMACHYGYREVARDAFAQFRRYTSHIWKSPRELEIWRRWSQAGFLDGEHESVHEGPRVTLLKLAWLPDGRHWATCDEHGRQNLWDADAGRLVRRGNGPATTRHAAFSAAGDVAIRLTTDDRIYLDQPSPQSPIAADGSIDVATRAEFIGQHSKALAMALSPDGRWLATSAADGTFKLWDVAARELSNTWRTQPHFVTAIAFTADGETIIAGSTRRTVLFWERDTRRVIAELPPCGAPPKQLVVSPHGELLAVLADQELTMWKLSDRTRLGGLDELDSPWSELAFSPDGRRLATGLGASSPVIDGDVSVWDTATLRRQRVFHGHRASVRSLAFSPDGARLASCGDDMTIRVWKLD